MLRRIAIVLMTVVALTGFSGIALAQSYGSPGVSGDNQTVAEGDSITITFTNLPPNTDFDVTVQSTVIDLGVHTSDANGNLTVTFSTAGLEPGSHTVTATATNGSGVTAVAHFTVTGASAGGTSGTTSGSALPRTGSSSTVPALSIALAIFALGGLLVFVSRRRRLA